MVGSNVDVMLLAAVGSDPPRAPHPVALRRPIVARAEDLASNNLVHGIDGLLFRLATAVTVVDRLRGVEHVVPREESE